MDMRVRWTWLLVGLVAIAGGLTLLRSAESPEYTKYISRRQATDIALEHANINYAPQGLRVTLREDPPRWTETSATWAVYSQEPYLDYTIDAETGKVLLVGVRSDD